MLIEVLPSAAWRARYLTVLVAAIAVGTAGATGVIPRDTSEIPGVGAVVFSIAMICSGIGTAVLLWSPGARRPRLSLGSDQVFVRKLAAHDIRCRPLAVSLEKLPVVPLWVLKLECVGLDFSTRLVVGATDYPGGIDKLRSDLERWRAARP